MCRMVNFRTILKNNILNFHGSRIKFLWIIICRHFLHIPRINVFIQELFLTTLLLFLPSLPCCGVIYCQWWNVIAVFSLMLMVCSHRRGVNMHVWWNTSLCCCFMLYALNQCTGDLRLLINGCRISEHRSSLSSILAIFVTMTTTRDRVEKIKDACW